jgi:hypothetical protein
MTVTQRKIKAQMMFYTVIWAFGSIGGARVALDATLAQVIFLLFFWQQFNSKLETAFHPQVSILVSWTRLGLLTYLHLPASLGYPSIT